MRFNTPQHLPCSQKEQKPNNMISLSCAKDLDITSLHFESTPCVFGKLVSDVKDEKCCSVGFFTHTAGSSISGNISHSASLTPSALLQYPLHFSILSLLPLASLPICLLYTLWPLLTFLSAALPCPISGYPSLSLSLSSQHPPTPPPTIFSDFLTCRSTECYHLCL